MTTPEQVRDAFHHIKVLYFFRDPEGEPLLVDVIAEPRGKKDVYRITAVYGKGKYPGQKYVHDETYLPTLTALRATADEAARILVGKIKLDLRNPVAVAN